jgi:hypothetical protein
LGKLADLHFSRGDLSDDEAGTLAHAMPRISESMEKEYRLLMPGLLSEHEASSERMELVLWSMRAEVRRTEYHVHDAQLADL